MESNKQESVIGIDLGTTNSCVSILRNEQAEIIPDNETGESIIPSMICFKDNQCLVGIPAKNNFKDYPKSTMYNSKRLIGHQFSNYHVQNDIKNWPIEVIEDKKTGKPQYLIKIGNEEKKYYPEKVSSMILEYIKNMQKLI